MEKYSKQKDAILTYLKSTTSHPTADIVYEHVKTVIPNISLGTVYRNLQKLSENGEILRLSCGEDFDRYDATTTRHYHFYCRVCKQVSDLSVASLDHINIIAKENFSGAIEGHSVFFYGLCPECLKKKKNA